MVKGDRIIMSKANIERLFGVINKSLFRIDGTLPYDRVTEAIIKLCEVIKDTETDEFIWSEVGEFGDCCLGDLIMGAFWHYVEWHAGQWSDGYRALSILGTIFDPGMTSIESEDNKQAYEMLNEMAEKETARS